VIRVLELLLAAAAVIGAGQPAKQPESPPACAPVDSKRSGAWQDVHLREFSLSLPACFVEYEDPEHRFVHGGLLWRCGDRKADLAWGMWSPSSFGSSWKLCSTIIAGIPAVVGRSETDKAVGVMVWYRTGSVHEPVASAWSPKPAPLAEMNAIVYSGRKGP
jgi:hypothetical protein